MRSDFADRAVGHSALAPSSAATRMQCPGSRFMESLRPDIKTPKSEEGDLAHLVLKHTLLGLELPVGATDEMLDGAELFVDALPPNAGDAHVEEAVDCSVVHPMCYGTPDYWTWDAAGKMLHVRDYKFGHLYVDAFENWQLIEYALGIIDSHRLSETWEDGVAVLTIVQPRCFVGNSPVRSWAVPFADLCVYRDRLAASELASMQQNAPTKTGSECRFCKARSTCTSLQQAAHAVVDMAGESTPHNLTPAALGGELAMLTGAMALLKGRIDGLQEETLQRVKQGANVPGWRIEQGQGREKWVRSVEEVIALGEMMGVDVSKRGVITPRQAVKAGLAEELVQSYAARPMGELKLVPDDLNKARSVFTGQ